MRCLLAFAALSVAFAQSPRITPPTVQSISPRGLSRGMTAELVIEGFNLANASAIFFSDPKVTGKILRVKELPDLPDVRIGANGTQSSIDVGPLPPRNQVTVEVDIDPETEIGDLAFRLQTPLGTSPEGTLLIEPYVGEAPDKEPNDTLAGAFETYLPAVLTGAISKPGDLDHFKITTRANQTLVFENSSGMIGSSLQPVIAILDAVGNVLKTYGEDGETVNFSHRFDKAGTYYLRIADYEKSGRASHQYRIKVGEFALLSKVFPLGLRRDGVAKIQLSGFNLPPTIEAKGTPSPDDPFAAVLRPASTYNKVKLALGSDPELTVTQPSPKLTLPVTLNGQLTKANQVHKFSFTAKKGQPLVFEVMARRLGSDLDTTIEIQTAAGQPIEVAAVRPVVETFTTLRDHDSAQPGVRITHWNNINAGDFMMLGREIVRVSELPRGPDEDIRYEALNGQRITFYNTAAEAHAIDKAVYKVQIHPPGTQFAPNGLPVTRLYAQNDDGGPGFMKDSYLTFTAPADGDYQLLLRDVTGATGAYRLNIREPRPDFRLSVNPRNPNVPRGSSVPLTVTAMRLDGYAGPIDVSLANLPAGFTATKAQIQPNQNTAVLLLTAAADSKAPKAFPFAVSGTALGLTRQANPEDKLKLISLAAAPDLTMTSETRSVELAPGETAAIKVKIARHNGFAGRVPVDVVNLPPRVKLPDFGLNGVLLNEDETERTFYIEATPAAEPGDYAIAVAGRIETRSTQQNLYAAPDTIAVRIRRK
jgi:hypothetical protein